MSSVPKFTDRSDKRVWFEEVVNWHSQMKGKSGLPILYVIRETAALPPPAEDPGFGQPDFATELSNRGGLSGHWWNGERPQVQRTPSTEQALMEGELHL